MSGTKFIKKTALSILMTVFAVCTGSAIALGVAPEKTYTASAESIQVEVGVSETDYSVATASVRLPDETYDSGALRYHVKMSVEKYNSIFNTDGSVKEANTKTGALILPAYLMGEATELTYSTPNVMDVNTTSAWDPVYKADGSVDYYEVKVCLTGIPQPNHSSKLVVRSYVKDASGNYVYTTQKDSASISDVALSVYNNANTSSEDKAVLKTTYLDKVITYNRNGETVTKTAMYGSTMAALEAENNEFIAWYDANGVEYDFNSTITSGNVTLYGVYEQNIVATAETPKVDMSAYTAGGKYTVAGVTLDGTNVSSSADPAVLQIPASLGLGDKELTVTLEKADGSQIEVPVSATILTGLISTAEDWLALLPKAGDTGITNGQQHYYKLTNNLDLVYGEYYNDPDYINGDDTQKAAVKEEWKQNIEAGFLQIDGNGWWPSSDKAFMGIIDGNGYTVQCSSRWSPHGQFCVLDGAVIKDVTFNNIYYYSINHAPMFARYIFNTTMEDVVINITGYAQSGYLDSIDKVNVEYNGSKLHALGMIAVCGFSKNTLKRVNIYADNVWKSATEPSAGLTIASIFGSDYEKLGANTFEDCVISADEVRNVGYVTNIDAANQTYEYTSLVAEEAGLTIIKSGEHTHAYEKWIVSSDVDTLVCSGCSRPNGITFDKTVDATSQEIVLKGAGTQSISLAGISAYNSVSSIKYGDYNLGNDINSLVIPSELQQDTQNHGYQTITVVVDDTVTEDGRHTVTVPVLLITDAIATMEELEAAVRYYGTNKNGYYILSNNVSYEESVFAWDNAASVTWDTVSGFIGTLDGRGNTITVNLNDSKYTYGLFGMMNGVVQNVTIEAKSADSASQTVLARLSCGTYDNVTINIYGSARGDYGERNAEGAIVQGALYNNGTKDKWNKVTINSDVAISRLFGLEKNVQDKASFTDCVLTCPTFTSFYSDNIVTELSGWTVNTSLVYEVAIDVQDVILSDGAPSLDLGDYADVIVSNIATQDGAYTFGTDVNALSIPANLPVGQNTLVINGTKGDDYYVITAPVCFVTDVITTMKGLSDAVRYYGTDKTGYYILGDNIAFDNSALGKEATQTYTENGFAGTLDGRGYMITWDMSASNSTNGIFGTLNKALIKNLTVDAVNYVTGYRKTVLANYSRASLSNVTINISGTGGTSSSTQRGAVVGNANYLGTWTNVTINSKVHLSNVFGDGADTGVTFTDCVINTPSFDSLDKTRTSINGITVNIVGTNATLDEQIVLKSNPSLDLGYYADMTIESIKTKDGKYDFGTTATALTIPDGFAMGDYTLVAIGTSGGDLCTLTVPVTFADGIITTMEELETAVRYYGTNKTGYYVLGNDITFDASALDSAASTSYEDVGFKGTLDGKGFTINWDMSETVVVQYGIFGSLGSGSVLKNFTVEAINYKKSWGACVLAYYSRASLTNVTINLDGTATDSTEGGYSMIVGNALYSGAWTDVEINSKIAMGSLFGMGANAGATFTDCVINAPSIASLDKGNTRPSGLTINFTVAE